MSTKDAPKEEAPKEGAAPETAERVDAFSFTPEEVAAADTSKVDGDQWAKRDADAAAPPAS